MEIRHRILVFEHGSQYKDLKKTFDDLKIKYEVKTGCIICFLSDNDPNYEKLKPKIYHQHVIVQTGMYFSQKDIDDSEWFYLNTSESLYPEGEDYHLETYELSNWCDKCGIGAVQNRPFRLLRDFQQKRDQFFGLHWVFDEIFARPLVRPILEGNGIKGLSYLSPIYHQSEKSINTTVQLMIDFILQPGLVNDGLDISAFAMDRMEWTTQDQYAGYCPFCKRVKYRYPKRDVIRFQRKILENVPDVVKSNEYFGAGAQAQRLVLVSRKFYDVIKENKLKGLVFTPIRLM